MGESKFSWWDDAVKPAAIATGFALLGQHAATRGRGGRLYEARKARFFADEARKGPSQGVEKPAVAAREAREREIKAREQESKTKERALSASDALRRAEELVPSQRASARAQARAMLLRHNQIFYDEIARMKQVGIPTSTANSFGADVRSASTSLAAAKLRDANAEIDSWVPNARKEATAAHAAWSRAGSTLADAQVKARQAKRVVDVLAGRGPLDDPWAGDLFASAQLRGYRDWRQNFLAESRAARAQAKQSLPFPTGVIPQFSTGGSAQPPPVSTYMKRPPSSLRSHTESGLERVWRKFKEYAVPGTAADPEHKTLSKVSKAAVPLVAGTYAAAKIKQGLDQDALVARVQGFAKQADAANAASLTNAVNQAVSVDTNALYSTDGFDRYRNGISAALRLGDALTAANMVKAVPPDAAYMHGYRLLKDMDAAERRHWQMSGREPEEFTDAEVQKFLGRYLLSTGGESR